VFVDLWASAFVIDAIEDPANRILVLGHFRHRQKGNETAAGSVSVRILLANRGLHDAHYRLTLLSGERSQTHQPELTDQPDQSELTAGRSCGCNQLYSESGKGWDVYQCRVE